MLRNDGNILDPSYQKQVFAAWRRFINGEDLPDGLVEPHILEGWRLCRSHGVDPLKEPDPPRLSNKELGELKKKNKLLLDAAQPMLKLLEVSIKDTGYIAVLGLACGVVLEVVGDKHLAKQAELHFQYPGMNRNLTDVGATAMSTALLLKKPVRIYGHEHYNQHEHDWKCAGAPIFDHNDEVIAALTLSSSIHTGEIHTLLLAQACADGISTGIREKVMTEKQQTFRALLESVHDAIPEAVIAVDRDGKVIHANKKGHDFFDSPIIGEEITSLFPKKEAERIRHILDQGLAHTGGFTHQAKSGSQSLVWRFEPIDKRQDHRLGTIISISLKKQAIEIANQVGGNYAPCTFADIKGRSPVLKKQIDLARKAARTSSRILLTGESGTGKELFAQAIHNESLVSGGPFVAVSCAAIPRDLVESELFGYVSGAFTGARQGGLIGKMELANSGTFFLDEVNSLPLDIQAKLLRALQQKQIVRIGDSKPTPIDARIIAATNVNLNEAVKNGTFREDLYFRLNVIDISLPTLRDRCDDILHLASLFLEKQAHELGLPGPRLADEVGEAFRAYSWPGNIRELENVCERSLLYSSGEVIKLEHIPECLHNAGAGYNPPSGVGKIGRLYNDIIISTIDSHGGNLTKAAAELGIARTTLYRRIKKLKDL